MLRTFSIQINKLKVNRLRNFSKVVFVKMWQNRTQIQIYSAFAGVELYNGSLCIIKKIFYCLYLVTTIRIAHVGNLESRFTATPDFQSICVLLQLAK
jgi:hypothetical protein